MITRVLMHIYYRDKLQKDFVSYFAESGLEAIVIINTHQRMQPALLAVYVPATNRGDRLFVLFLKWRIRTFGKFLFKIIDDYFYFLFMRVDTK